MSAYTPATGSAAPSSAAPSAPPSVAASADTPSTSLNGSHANGQKAEAGVLAGPLDLAQFAFSVGFMQQQWADIQLVFFTTSLKLHRLVLARSPYLANVMATLGIGATHHLQLPDGNVTEESLFICIHHLYTPSLHLVNATNARAVLATSYTLSGLPDLVAHAYAVVRASIDASTVTDYVRWLSRPTGPSVSAPNGNGYLEHNGTYGGAPEQPQQPVEDWENAGAPYGEWSERLKQDVLDFLLHTLPAQLAASSPSTPLHASSVLLATYVALPFALFKHVVESPALPIGSMQDRFGFAKRAIAQRKKRGPAATAATAAADESVVLALKGGDGMDVHITRKARRARQALWKVEG
ncbi:hypothetical protein Q5752_001519 [Cryptotrichosporon argae]